MRRLAIFLMLLSQPLIAAAQSEGVTALDPISSPYLVKLTLGLILVVALIFGFAWLLKKLNFNQQSQTGLMRIVAGLSIGTRDRIVLLQVGEEQILLGLTPGRIEKLHTLTKTLDAPAQKSMSSPFAEKLHRLMGERESS